MQKESTKFEDKSIKIIQGKKLDSSFKVSSYKKRLKLMEKEEIKQKPIEKVLKDFFSKDLEFISKSTKKSISKIIYFSDERLIIVESAHAREIIWKREQLVKRYGWYFFVTKKYISKRNKGKKKGKKSKETTLSEETYKAEDFHVDLIHKKNMRSLYHTKEYHRYFQIINSKHIKTMPIKETLEDFFLRDRSVPKKEKQSIQKIIYYEEEKVIVVKSLIGDKMYENLENLVRKYGWYFYITGVPVGESKICHAIDKIEKRYNASYFEDISISKNLENKEKIRLILYPIMSRPNHNCLILGIGQLNILLDCGIEKEALDDIDEYLENLNSLIQQDEHKKLILSKNEKKNQKDKDNQDIQEISKEISPENINIVLNKEEFEPKIDAVFISHSHYDHISGLLDFVKAHPDIPILCSRITLDLYLLRDSDFLDQEKKDKIEQEEYRNVVRNVIYVENGDKIEFKEKDCYLAFFHAGHMPGALMMLAKAKDYRFLYTGDYTYYDITPFAGTKRFLDQISRPLDFLLIDGSSAYEEFGNPSQHFHSLILFLEQKAEYGNSSLIGADPSSLAISFMLKFWRHFRKKQLRHDYKKRPNIYVDMMVRKNIQVINHRYKYIYGPISRLIRNKANPFNSIKFRWFNHDNLDFLRKRNNVIISHPPDLSYGIIKKIINVVGRSPHNLVFLAGGINEEPGLSLVNPPKEEKKEDRILDFSETWKVPFRALLLNTFAPQIKIKLHGDKTQLTEMIKNLEPAEVCFFHESPRKLQDVADYVISLGVKKVSIPQENRIMILNQ
jgi:Cft2 family RNA processing exonuclease